MDQERQKEITANWQGEWPSLQGPSPVVLVGGAARSGTTLAQAILCSAPQVNPLIEESVPLRLLIEAYQKNVAHQERFPGAYFSDLDEVGHFYRRQVLLFLEQVQHRYNCRRLVLKEPALTRLFPVLLELVPDSVLVCMVRDPRAAIVSMLGWGEKMAQEGRKHFFQNRDMDELSEFFNSFYFPLFRSDSVSLWERMAFLRFEDLLNEPQLHLKRLNEFTQLDLSGFNPASSWPRSTIDFEDANLPQRAAVTPFYGQALEVRQAKPDVFTAKLSREEIETVEKKCWLIMKMFSYAKLKSVN